MEKASINKKTKNPFKLIPWYGWVGAILFLGLHLGLYMATNYLLKLYVDNYWSYNPKIPALDDLIPFFPYFFAQLYYAAYAIWIVCPLMVSVTGKRNFTNFMLYSIICYVIGAIIFLTMPAWQSRVDEGLYEKIEQIKTPFTKWMMNIIVSVDSGDKAWNMAPSFHVTSCLCCMLGVFRQKKVHIAGRITDYVLNFLIIIGVLLIKQHYIYDIFFAGAIVGLVYIIVYICDPAKKIIEEHPNFLEIKKKAKKNLNKVK